MKPQELTFRTNTETNSSEEPSLRDIPLTLRTIPGIPFLLLIRLYQVTISRLIPVNTCRFYPTCSHYSFQAITRHGILKGGLLSIWRVIRCNPFCRGGYDPVP